MIFKVFPFAVLIRLSKPICFNERGESIRSPPILTDKRSWHYNLGAFILPLHVQWKYIDVGGIHL